MLDPEKKAAPRGETRPVVYTVGSSTRTQEEFLDLLRYYGITIILDVRRFPTSQRYPHFTRSSLASWLAEADIAYHYLGETLGGYRRGGYEAYTQTASFRKGLEQVLSLAGQGPAAILCCERFPWKCHRRFIAQYLSAAGWHVVHVLDRGRVYAAP
ncbi:MAG: DUF488 domain-containing protein [Bacillota bacterium]